MREAILAAITRRETYVISKIKSNPKYFYSYIKSFDKCKESLNMLYARNGRITTDSKQIADTLQSQFSSVYSNPDSPNIKQPEFPDRVIDFPFSGYDISVTEKDIIEAIGELKCNSACGPVQPVLLDTNTAAFWWHYRRLFEQQRHRQHLFGLRESVKIANAYVKNVRIRSYFCVRMITVWLWYRSLSLHLITF